MCEMMGLCFQQPVVADFSMKPFAAGDQENPDGWGVAWYPDRSLGIVKEAHTWRKSGFAQFIESYPGLESCLHIAHIRKKSTGGPATHADTHPFHREYRGREYCFAHNGTIPEYRSLTTSRYEPLGGTDSERIFCHLLSQMADQQISLQQETSWMWLFQRLRQINQQGSLNCLLSDGDRLFAYRDRGGWKGLTARLVRFQNDEHRRFQDESSELQVSADGLNRGYVLATRPLSDHGWHALTLGSLVVFDAGQLVYSSAPGNRRLLTPLNLENSV